MAYNMVARQGRKNTLKSLRRASPDIGPQMKKHARAGERGLTPIRHRRYQAKELLMEISGVSHGTPAEDELEKVLSENADPRVVAINLAWWFCNCTKLVSDEVKARYPLIPKNKVQPRKQANEREEAWTF